MLVEQAQPAQLCAADLRDGFIYSPQQICERAQTSTIPLTDTTIPLKTSLSL